MKFSFVVPVHGVDDYLNKCISSILNISKYELECIVVCDGASEYCINLCMEFRKKDSRVKVIVQNNQGVSVARNVGIAAAKGDWLIFCDGDDYVDSRILEKVDEYIRSSDVDIVVFDYYCLYDGKKEVENMLTTGRKIFEGEEKECLFISAVTPIYYGLKNHANVGVPWAKAYKTEFIKKNGISFEPILRRKQDMVFNLNAFVNAGKIGYFDVPLYYYCVHNGSAVNRYYSDYEVLAMAILDSIHKIDGLKEYACYKDVYYARTIGELIDCFNLQIMHKDNKKSIGYKLKEIKRVSQIKIFSEAIQICNDKYLSNTQKLGLMLLRKRWYLVLVLALQFKATVKRGRK